jgi:hypothetical protein
MLMDSCTCTSQMENWLVEGQLADRWRVGRDGGGKGMRKISTGSAVVGMIQWMLLEN